MKELEDDGGPSAQEILGANLVRLQDYAKLQWVEWRKTIHPPDDPPPPPASDKALCSACGISRKTLLAVRRGSRPAQINTVDAIARAYGLRAYQLLVQNLEPDNPATLAITETEVEMLRAFRISMARMKAKAGSVIEGKFESGIDSPGGNTAGPAGGKEVGESN